MNIILNDQYLLREIIQYADSRDLYQIAIVNKLFYKIRMKSLLDLNLW